MDIYVSTESAFGPSQLRRFNVWYSCNSGNWSDPNTWYSNALDKKNVTSPRTGDVVYINHTVNLDVSASVSNLYISGKLTASNSGLTLSVTGDIQASGIVDFTGSNVNLILYGYNNFITTFTAGSTSSMTYYRAGTQLIMNLSYRNLNLFGIGTKFMTSDLTILGALNVNNFQPEGTIMECGAWNLQVNGAANFLFGNMNSNNQLSKTGSGTLLFIGNCSITSNINITSAVTSVEFRGGISGGPVGGTVTFGCPVIFSTNSQTMNVNAVFTNTVTIKGAITVNNTNGTGPLFKGVVNGDNASSTLTNNGYMGLGSTTVPMATGVFNYMTGATSTIDYNFNGNYTLPYTTYRNLGIHGTGTKTLSGNTSVQNVKISDFDELGEILECSTFDLTINGTFSIAELTTGKLSKSSAGTIIFVGMATWNSSYLDYASNVTLEFRGGATIGVVGTTNTCNATINFTTNNQTLTVSQQVFGGPVNIAAGITLNYAGGGNSTNATSFTGAINGLSGTSILQMALNSFLNYQNATAPMVTGKLYGNQATNTFIYGASGNQDIQVPSDPSTPGYKNLILQGSGAKKLLGNVSVKGTYTLTAPATLNSNGFALTNP